MNNTYVLDTSIILALINKNDTQHQQAKDTIFDLKPDTLRFEVPMVCYLEALNQNPFPEEFTAFLTELINKRDFELTTKTDAEYIVNLPLQIRTKLKSNDCSVIAITKRLKAELLTLDKFLQKFYDTLA